MSNQLLSKWWWCYCLRITLFVTSNYLAFFFFSDTGEFHTFIQLLPLTGFCPWIVTHLPHQMYSSVIPFHSIPHPSPPDILWKNNQKTGDQFSWENGLSMWGGLDWGLCPEGWTPENTWPCNGPASKPPQACALPGSAAWIPTAVQSGVLWGKPLLSAGPKRPGPAGSHCSNPRSLQNPKFLSAQNRFVLRNTRKRQLWEMKKYQQICNQDKWFPSENSEDVELCTQTLMALMMGSSVTAIT